MSYLAGMMAVKMIAYQNDAPVPQDRLNENFIVYFYFSNGTQIDSIYCEDLYKDQIDAYINGSSSESIYYDNFYSGESDYGFSICPDTK